MTVEPFALGAQIDFRVGPADSQALTALEALLGSELPLVPNTASEFTGGSVLWLGPDEWLLLASDGSGAEWEGHLRTAVTDAFVTIVDVSKARLGFELVGIGARKLLESGCAVDLHPRAFAPGSCVQTLLARVPVLLWQTSPEPRYRVLVRSSLAPYLESWFTDATDA